jgi:hypothetical protein
MAISMQPHWFQYASWPLRGLQNFVHLLFYRKIIKWHVVLIPNGRKHALLTTHLFANAASALCILMPLKI